MAQCPLLRRYCFALPELLQLNLTIQIQIYRSESLLSWYNQSNWGYLHFVSSVNREVRKTWHCYSLNPLNGKKPSCWEQVWICLSLLGSTVKVHRSRPDSTKPPKGSVYTIRLHRVNPYQDRHALPLTPVVDLKRLSTKWISNLPLCAQSVSEEGLHQMLGFNPREQPDTSKLDFAPNQKGSRRERWRKMTCLVYVNACVGVATLWVNLFFQCPFN